MYFIYIYNFMNIQSDTENAGTIETIELLGLCKLRQVFRWPENVSEQVILVLIFYYSEHSYNNVYDLGRLNIFFIKELK